MSEERIEVLRMVADGVIGVDDAERLLRALGDGEPKRSESRRHTSVSGAFDGVGEALGAIGQAVQSTVHEAMAGVDIALDAFDVGEDEPGMELDGSAFEILDGGQLSIRQIVRTGRGPSCSLTLLATDGNRCTIEAGEGAMVQVRRRGNKARIQWRQGPLTVHVPATVAEIDAKVLGGDLVARDLAGSLEANVMGGRIELRSVRKSFDCKVMGGDIVVGLSAETNGRSRAESVGGNVVLEVQDGIQANILAQSTGGELHVDSTLGKVERQGSRIQRRSSITLGASRKDAAEISLKTIGGDIHVRREQH